MGPNIIEPSSEDLLSDTPSKDKKTPKKTLKGSQKSSKVKVKPAKENSSVEKPPKKIVRKKRSKSKQDDKKQRTDDLPEQGKKLSFFEKLSFKKKNKRQVGGNQTSKANLAHNQTQVSDVEDVEDGWESLVENICEKHRSGSGCCNTNTIIFKPDKIHGGNSTGNSTLHSEALKNLENDIRSEAQNFNKLIEEVLSELYKQKKDLMELKEMFELLLKLSKDNMFMRAGSGDAQSKRAHPRRTNGDLYSSADKVPVLRKDMSFDKPMVNKGVSKFDKQVVDKGVPKSDNNLVNNGTSMQVEPEEKEKPKAEDKKGFCNRLKQKFKKINFKKKSEAPK